MEMGIRATGGGVVGDALAKSTESPTTLGRLSEALDALNGSVVRLDDVVGCSHTKLFGEYSFPPEGEPENFIEPDGIISDLTARVRGIERRVMSTLEVAESTGAQL